MKSRKIDLPRPNRIGSPENQIRGGQRQKLKSEKIAAGADARAKRTIVRRTKDSTRITPGG